MTIPDTGRLQARVTCGEALGAETLGAETLVHLRASGGSKITERQDAGPPLPEEGGEGCVLGHKQMGWISMQPANGNGAAKPV